MLTYGTKADHRRGARQLERYEAKLRARLERFALADTVDGWLDGRDHWLDASEALDHPLGLNCSRPRLDASGEKKRGAEEEHVSASTYTTYPRPMGWSH
jgi:hypothetical protein